MATLVANNNVGIYQPLKNLEVKKTRLKQVHCFGKKGNIEWKY